MMTELAKTFGISSGQNRAINEQSKLKLNATVVNIACLIKIPLSKLMTLQIRDLLFLKPSTCVRTTENFPRENIKLIVSCIKADALAVIERNNESLIKIKRLLGMKM